LSSSLNNTETKTCTPFSNMIPLALRTYKRPANRRRCQKTFGEE